MALVLTQAVCAQSSAPRKKASKGPRALGLLQLFPNGTAHLIPITILIDGNFYDAGAYKAAPVPMALESQTVYEAVQTGVSKGMFTVGGVRQTKDSWIADGSWLPAGPRHPELPTKPKPSRTWAMTRALQYCTVRARKGRPSPHRLLRLQITSSPQLRPVSRFPRIVIVRFCTVHPILLTRHRKKLLRQRHLQRPPRRRHRRPTPRRVPLPLHLPRLLTTPIIPLCAGGGLLPQPRRNKLLQPQWQRRSRPRQSRR